MALRFVTGGFIRDADGNGIADDQQERLPSGKIGEGSPALSGCWNLHYRPEFLL